ncbi:MAG: hypothetical protein ACI9DF_005433, partial [Verrucomicrobiales bacterium]
AEDIAEGDAFDSCVEELRDHESESR